MCEPLFSKPHKPYCILLGIYVCSLEWAVMCMLQVLSKCNDWNKAKFSGASTQIASSLAQLAERKTVNLEAAGSIPAWRAFGLFSKSLKEATLHHTTYLRLTRSIQRPPSYFVPVLSHCCQLRPACGRRWSQTKRRNGGQKPIVSSSPILPSN